MKRVKLPEDDLIQKDIVERKTFKDKLKSFFKSVWDFSISKPNPKESVVQWAIRQFILADSEGNPSWTITIAFIVMVYIGMTLTAEITVATSTVKVYDKTTGILSSESMKGFSDSFYYLLITLGGAITYLFQQRGKKKNETGVSENGTTGSESFSMDAIVNKVLETIKKMKGNK
ncbi:MAG TPA: hypothetical protein P5136_02770 [Methanofastidiosum sp.]|nr:hypothetical protein [Methanofastidiosum sp.]